MLLFHLLYLFLPLRFVQLIMPIPHSIFPFFMVTRFPTISGQLITDAPIVVRIHTLFCSDGFLPLRPSCMSCFRYWKCYSHQEKTLAEQSSHHSRGRYFLRLRTTLRCEGVPLSSCASLKLSLILYFPNTSSRIFRHPHPTFVILFLAQTTPTHHLIRVFQPIIAYFLILSVVDHPADATNGRNGGAQRILPDHVLEMEKFRYRAGGKRSGSSSLGPDLAKAFAGAWATHFKFTKKISRCHTGTLRNRGGFSLKDVWWGLSRLSQPFQSGVVCFDVSCRTL